MKNLTFISGALFSSLTVLGLHLKIMHWPGANIGLTLGLVGLALIFIPTYATYQYKKSN